MKLKQTIHRLILSTLYTMVEMNPYVLITQPVFPDIHINLNTIPLETIYTLPYGLIYANDPSTAIVKYINAVKKVNK